MRTKGGGKKMGRTARMPEALILLVVSLLLLLILASACSTPGEKMRSAIDRGDGKGVSSMLKSGYDAKRADYDLTRAASNGNAEIVKLLLDAGASVNASNEQGKTPLMFASETGAVEVVKLLLEHNADVNRQADALVCEETFTGDVKLQQHSGTINGTFVRLSEQKGVGNNALSFAVLRGRADVVRCLIQNGADVGRIVVYKSAEMHMPYLTQLTSAMAVGCESIGVYGGHDVVFTRRERNGWLTNQRTVPDESATIKELAERSNDKGIQVAVRGASKSAPSPAVIPPEMSRILKELENRRNSETDSSTGLNTLPTKAITNSTTPPDILTTLKKLEDRRKAELDSAGTPNQGKQ